MRAASHEDVPEWAGLSFYLALGWLGAGSAALLARRHGPAFVGPLVLGGVLYTAGAALEVLAWPVLLPGVVHPHELFHLAVLAGAACHWRFIWQFASGEVPGPRARDRPDRGQSGERGAR